jgi:predicted RNA-binding Zn-ribbon protein involved in translation (DUF1610 family)
MKRLSSVLLTVLGVCLVLLGLLFLIGAGGRGYRYLIAVISLALGGALAGLGIRLFKQADAASPAQLRADILALAKREDGEISEGEVMAGLGRRAAGAPAVLAAMVDEGLCEQRTIKGAPYFVFRELQPRLMVRRCEYCNAELPLAGEVTECPNCGGTIKTQVESRSLSKGEDVYSMDDE